ncbi:MAG: Verru_Chthon cassette protein C [Chthoniobacteraceae bacterium]
MSPPRSQSGPGGGFTLIELMVSMGILSLLLFVLISMTNTTQRTWTNTTEKIEQFREAREAFEAMARRLSLATLNTYWDYHYPNNNTSAAPDGYIRQSELRFICGDAATLTGSANTAGHAVFFQAPLGFVSNTSYANLNTLLNTWGYFIEFSNDSAGRPDFINSMAKSPALRYRFRLMELMEPGESLSLYNAEVAAGGNQSYTGSDWFTTPLSSANRPVRILAENIVALVLLPKLSPADDATETLLCPKYSYNSVKTNDANSVTADAAINWKNQLPPEIQVVMVAVDEASYSRFQTDTAMPSLTAGLFADANKFTADLDTLQTTLRSHRLNYRIFTSTIGIKGAKWSREQTN